MVVRLATKWGSSGGEGPCEIRMSVFELAMFMRIFRDENPVDPGDVAATVGHWFECDVTVAHVRAVADRMIRKGWLTHREGGLRAAPDGRDQARVSLHGIINFMRMGTKLLDVALMMNILNVAKHEVDPPYEEDLDPIDEDLDHPDAPDRWLTRDGWTDIDPATGKPDPWRNGSGPKGAGAKSGDADNAASGKAGEEPAGGAESGDDAGAGDAPVDSAANDGDTDGRGTPQPGTNEIGTGTPGKTRGENDDDER